ncbi:MAG: LacI family DNA-binding transcriptional regulator [Elusimicrobiota bacterium]
MSLTIRDIAQKSGVSVATVSRVINGSELVRPETKKKVLKVIKEHNYQPNMLARAFSKSKSETIGLIVPPETHIFSDYFAEMLRGIENAARLYNYDLLLKISTPASRDSYHQYYEMKKCDGLLLIAPVMNDLGLKNLEKKDIPMVLINCVSTQISYVDVDNVDGAFKAVEHLVKRGHKRIGIINGIIEGVNAQDRYKGYQLALMKYHIPEDKELITYGKYSQQSGIDAMQKLMSLDNKPTAVFAANDLMAIGAIKVIKDAGLAVPKDIAVVGYDDLILAAISDPPLTSIHQPIFDVGKEAVRLLVDQMDKGQKSVQKVVLETELVVRQSSGDDNPVRI